MRRRVRSVPVPGLSEPTGCRGRLEVTDSSACEGDRIGRPGWPEDSTVQLRHRDPLHRPQVRDLAGMVAVMGKQTSDPVV